MLQIRELTMVHRKDLRTILREFNLVLDPGDKTVLIGEEGNGKSTLLKWIFDPASVEEYIDAQGERLLQGAVLGYLPQELPDEIKRQSIFDYFSAIPAFESALPPELFGLAGRLKLNQEIFYSDQQMGSLSGGERVKVQLAGVLLAEPDILLLDEPSNDIDLPTLLWLEDFINQFPGAVLFISHDETLIERTANRVILMEQLRTKTQPRVTVANIPYRQFAEERERAFAKQEQEALNARREEKKAMVRFQRIEQSVEYAQEHISRQDPSGGRLLKKKMKAVKAMERRYKREREEQIGLPEKETPITIKFDRQKSVPAGKTVLDCQIPTLHAPDGRVLAENIHLRVKGPEKIAIIGENGAGKTTLLRQIAEEFKDRCDLTACYMPQNYEEALPYEQTPVDYLAPSGHKDDQTRARTYLGAMKYTADEMFHPIRDLSGGQKAKLLLLKISLTEADVLLLDEPTRNFSPLSGPKVREIIRGFPGAVISISHDRKFIREVCSAVYRLTPQGLKKEEIGAL